MIPYILLILIVILIFIIYKYFSIKREYNSILECIHHGENEIDKMLVLKSELLDVVCENINSISENPVFSPISKIMNKNMDSGKLERALGDVYSELREYLFVNKNYIPEDNIKEKINELKNLEVDLKAAKLFYNENSKDFNRMLDTFPSNIMGKRKEYDYKFFYTFEENQFFEILKKDKDKEEDNDE